MSSSDSGSPRLTVLAWPLDRRGENPYTNLLYGALEDRGVAAIEFSVRSLVRRRYDVLHVHWPEGVLPGRRAPAALAAALALGAILAVARLRGAGVVWTVHNERPHRTSSRASLAVLRLVLRMAVSGLIYLSQASRVQFESAHQWAARKPSTVTPHGRFEALDGDSLTDRSTVRRGLGVADSDILVAFLGRMEAYKGPAELVLAYGALTETAGISLLMAGSIPDDAVGNELRSLIRQHHVLLEEGWLDERRLAELIVASDLIVYPYRRILNSGSVLLPMEYGTRVLAPSFGSIPEVSAAVGDGWISLYEHSLTPSALASAIVARPPDAPPDLGDFSWAVVAELTEAAYRRSI